MKEARGYGKLILFGEHFVVYKVPALVAAITSVTTAKVDIVEGKTGWTVDDQRPAVPGYKVEKKEEQDEATRIVLEHLQIDLERQAIHITLGGDLTCASGIGASAANCVALARALSHTFSLGLKDEDVNRAAYEGEKGYHGTPSGIDNTASTYGGLLRFQRTDTDPIFELKSLPEGCGIVYASTGITASTTKVVGDVRAKKEADEAWFAALLDRYKAVFEKAEAALTKCDWPEVGRLMNENHTLCQELTVSCTELDTLVDAARAAGAIGAKMSGTGRGGLMVALTPTKELQDKVAAALEGKAPFVWKSNIGAAI